MDQQWTLERSNLDNRIVALLESGHYEQVISLADSASRAGCRDPRILGQKARALGALDKIEESVALFEDVLIEDYENCDNHLNFAVVLMRTGKIGRAITEFREALKFCGGKNRSMIYRNLAVANIKLGKKELALKDVSEGLRLNEDDSYLLGLKGMLIAENQPVEAESLFVRSLRYGGEDPELLFQFALLLMRTGRPDQALKALRTAASLRPGDRDIELNLAKALFNTGHFGEAERLLETLLEAGTDDDVRMLLGRVLFRQGRLEESMDMYLKLPLTPEVMDRIAMCLHGLGRLEEALKWEEDALNSRPNWTTAMVNMAVIRAARGELDEAMSLLNQVLAIEPGNDTARINVEKLKQAMGGKQE